jgi:hypothetical protein
MKSFAWLALWSMVVIEACLVGVPGQALSQELPDPSALREAAAGSSDPGAAVSSGLTVHIDPVTGRFTKAGGGVPMQLSPAEVNAMSTSHQGLVETLSPRPHGGAVMYLQGRFQSPLVATVDAQGKVTIQHLDPDSPSGETK